MASNREFIIVQSPVSANVVIAYEGTSGAVPWDLAGEYTTRAKAEQAIAMYKVKQASKAPVVNPEPVQEETPSGEVNGNSKRKQRV